MSHLVSNYICLNHWRTWIWRLLGLFVIFFVLSATLGVWSGVGSHIHQLISEFPLIVILFVVLFWSVNPRWSGKWRFILACALIVYAYLLYDSFFVVFGRYFLLIDWVNLPDLMDIMPWAYRLALLVVMGVPVVLWLWVARWRVLGMLLLLGVVYGLLVSMPQRVIDYFQAIYPGTFYEHSIVMDNGRFASLLYFEAKRRVVLADLQASQVQLFDQVHLPPPQNRPDIVVLVLESYVDPDFFASKQVVPTKTPFFFAHSHSPVFAGGTARAEFEVLCATPSYARYESNEFNLITQTGLPCYPNLLAQQGYHTIALNPYKPAYFNAMRAYQGVGFSHIYFHPDFYHSTHNCIRHAYPDVGFYQDEWLFDDLLACMDEQARTDNAPIFAYSMTTYGHSPFELPPTQANPYAHAGLEDDFARALTMGQQVNDALQQLNKRLMQRHRDYLLVVVGDHLPTFIAGQSLYTRYGYRYDIQQTPLAMYYNGHTVPIPAQISHYQLLDYVLCQLNQASCEIEIQRNNQVLMQRYQVLMKQAVSRTQ